MAFPAQNGYYKILNTSDGVNIIQWGYSGADNQNWRFESVGAGEFEIFSRRTGSSTTAGDRIVQVADTGTTSRQWQIIRVN